NENEPEDVCMTDSWVELNNEPASPAPILVESSQNIARAGGSQSSTSGVPPGGGRTDGTAPGTGNGGGPWYKKLALAPSGSSPGAWSDGSKGNGYGRCDGRCFSRRGRRRAAFHQEMEWGCAPLVWSLVWVVLRALCAQQVGRECDEDGRGQAVTQSAGLAAHWLAGGWGRRGTRSGSMIERESGK
ncbi:hypothetical protein FRC09_016994, partial [Ceratobasidium sp. 395]